MVAFALEPSNGPSFFSRFAAEVRDFLNPVLEAFLRARTDRATAIGDDVAAVVANIQTLTMRGGKRLRPVLLCAAYDGVRGPGRWREVIMAGVALELMQSYFLIHDDWIDQDDVRRGGASVHAALGRHFGSSSVGDGNAILAGDYAATLANEALLAVAVAPELVRRAASIMAEVQERVFFGQVLDVCGRKGTDVDLLHDLKTASYTVYGPLAMGATLAGASREQLESLERLARPLGIAFQIRDDLLGVFGKQAVTGKGVGGDLVRGKRTALMAELDADPDAQPLLARAFGVPDARAEDVLALTRYLETSGARSRVEAKLRHLVDVARQELERLAVHASMKRVLTGAIEFFAARDS